MSWISANASTIMERFVDHLVLSLPPILLAFLLALPLARLAVRFRPLRTPITLGSALLYAIPSLPLFIIMPLITGIELRSATNVIIALTLYGLALMVPVAADAFTAVDRDVLQSATAQGFAPMHRFLAVELPLAGPALVAGLRVVAVSTVSLATVGAVLGVPSLGSLFTQGFERNIMPSIVAGIVITALLAVLLDQLIVLIGRVLMPWTRGAGVRA
ncbi:ABC transporter permease subunit [Helcobacillus massiliensis]|uniref:Osmoprotectant transport system permease protein n=1 Tax=Helcobacillus massiliensis TaxID=521392 RepID=A0A839QUY8_9MICO|nr:MULTISPECIES: ABC transporter permease subunit [Helcobacillus]MBB3023545.1 osmoprotectant transport system permease protein [Helcobacillus massiliensis]MCG7428060.1 ABC transporter permease subunit [Helcobacillus sp. ACRRO]MCT1557550.1 ABC transporter permease subunit [Helcobacillus massiliensis]MCT2036775.1 ABC transporter permease subunit [Helcobacillus massiliensis]MCT2332472.1 ABC transporter permease subunit [Helcobacillus massiliensis]